eukprot:522243-Prorocentrum_minimum.AAC.1
MHRKTTPLVVTSLMLVRLPSEGVSPEEIRSLRETSEGYTFNPVYVALNRKFKFGQPSAPRRRPPDLMALGAHDPYLRANAEPSEESGAANKARRAR